MRKITGSEILKRDFGLLLEKPSNCQSQHVFISGPIPTLGRGMECFSRLLSLNTWLASACHTHGIKVLVGYYYYIP